MQCQADIMYLSVKAIYRPSIPTCFQTLWQLCYSYPYDNWVKLPLYLVRRLQLHGAACLQWRCMRNIQSWVEVMVNLQWVQRHRSDCTGSITSSCTWGTWPWWVKIQALLCFLHCLLIKNHAYTMCIRTWLWQQATASYHDSLRYDELTWILDELQPCSFATFPLLSLQPKHVCYATLLNTACNQFGIPCM